MKNIERVEKTIKIGLVDDNPQIEVSIRKIIESQEDFECSFVAQSLGQLFLQIDNRTDIDVLLLDIKLSEGNSLTHLHKVKRLLPETSIIVFTGNRDLKYIKQAINSGVDGFLLKGLDPKHCINAIREAVSGNAYMDPITTRNAFYSFNPPNFQEYFGLTDTETQTVQGLMEGLSYKMIAGRLEISIDSVRYNIKNIYKKMGINSKIELLKEIKKYLK